MKIRSVLLGVAAITGVCLSLLSVSTAGGQYPPPADDTIALASSTPNATVGGSVSIAATVQDAFNQPIAGRSCSFSIVSQPGTTATLTTATALTDGNGIASTNLNVGNTAGTITVESACGSLVAQTGVVAGIATSPAPQPAALPSAGFGDDGDGGGWAAAVLATLGLALIGLAQTPRLRRLVRR